MSVRFTDGSPEQLFHVLERKHHTAVDNLLSQNGISNIGQPVILSILSQQETAPLSPKGAGAAASRLAGHHDGVAEIHGAGRLCEKAVQCRGSQM